MKKNSFLSGAFISTFCIFVCKIIGLVYVIPFYSIIGTQGGTLYSYAYTIYSLFLTLSSQGIPVALSKIVSEYNTLNFNWSKERAYKIVRNLMVGLGTIWFILIMFFSKEIAYLIIGNIEGGNSIEDVSLVIRSISIALITVPFLSGIKGYLNGHKYLTQYALSNVIEQLVRVAFILIGSFLAAKVFHLPTVQVVCISVLGATVGAVAAYLYLLFKKKKNKELFQQDAVKVEGEENNTNKTILKRVISVAIPFIIIDIVRSIYSLIDTFTVNATLTSIGYTLSDSEYILSVISTWGAKLNMIVIAFVSGLTVSLIPNISSSYIKGDFTDIKKKLNQSVQMLLFITLPLALGMSLLATPIWNLFYGYNELGIAIFRVFVFQAIIFSFYSLTIDSSQAMGNTKLAMSALFTVFGLKLFLNIPFMKLCPLIGIKAQYAPTILNIIMFTLSSITIIIVQSKKYHISYRESLNPMIKTLGISAIMFAVLKVIEIFIPVNIITSKFNYLGLSILYATIGGIIYLLLSYKSGLITSIFGNSIEKKLNSILSKFKKKSKI